MSVPVDDAIVEPDRAYFSTICCFGCKNHLLFIKSLVVNWYCLADGQMAIMGKANLVRADPLLTFAGTGVMDCITQSVEIAFDCWRF